MPKQSQIRNSTLFLASCLLSLGILELVLRLWLPLADPYAVDKAGRTLIRSENAPNTVRRYEVSSPGQGPREFTRFTTNGLGFRGAEILSPKPANEFRIFLLGGSSAECGVLDDEDELGAALERSLSGATHPGGLDARVYNAGRSGNRSDDHIAMLTQRIVHLDPDLVVVFAGINDLRATIAGMDYLHREGHHGGPRRVPLLRATATELQVGRLAYYVLNWQPFQFRADARSEPTPLGFQWAVEWSREAPMATTVPEVDTSAYRRNLNTLAGVAAAHGFTMILMTQQTTWASEVDDGVGASFVLNRIGDLRYPDTELHKRLEALNGVMRDVARKHGLPLFDLTAVVPKSSRYFYDDVHFTVDGASMAATALSRIVTEVMEDLPGD